MPFIKKVLINLFVVLIIIFPVVSFSAGLVLCDGKSCDFNALMDLIYGVINFLLFKMALPIAAIMFAYAGFSMVTAPGGEAKGKAKEVFTNTVIGLVLAVACWIIISTLLSIFGYNGSWIGLKFTP